ncbi:MAG: hypothetical protein OXU62_11995 [Gammaproteobacteria bacterium]|nr:hypothetical protein [Gammaproteobacteria bacterium]
MNRKYTIAEEISHRTWFLLKLSQRPDVRLGEETLTDFLVIHLLLNPYNAVRVLPVMKPEEANNGADLMIYVRKDRIRAHKYVVQAKKLHPTYGQYRTLNRDAGKSGRKQIDVLEEYAVECDAVPLYLLYNHIEEPIEGYSKYWHCGIECLDETQFGCTLVPSWHIRDAIDVRGSRNFHCVHLNDSALPWRCAFDCPQGKNWRQIRERFEASYHAHTGKSKPDIDFEGGLKKWPSDLLSATAPFEPSSDDIMQIGDEKYVPRWIMLVDPFRD